MFTIKLKRIIVSGWRNFTRSGFTSTASILIMTITLLFITSTFFIQATLNSTLNNIKERVDVTVYFVTGAKQESIDNIANSLKNLPEVREITFTSAQEALDIFKERHSGDYLTLQALEELNENPLGASLNIKANDPSQYDGIVKYFEGEGSLSNDFLRSVDKIDYHQNKIIIDRLTSILDGAQKLGFTVSLILVLISLIITFNTIRLIIHMSKDEIAVMRLVGASHRYINGPFIISGVFVGIVSSLFTIILLIPISIWLGNQITDFIGLNLFTYYKSNFFQLFVIILLSGVLIGSISSFFAVHKYLKK